MRILLECSLGGEGAIERLRLLVIRSGPCCQVVLSYLTSVSGILSTAPLMH